MEITFRQARPQDVEIAVPLIYSTGPAAFEFAFKTDVGKDAQSFLTYAFVRPGSEFSFDCHICMEWNDQVVGIGGVYTGKDMPRFTLKAVQFILSYYGLVQGLKIIRRGLQLEKKIIPPKGNTEYFAHLAVNPEFQGKGIGTQLLDYFWQNGREKGRESASLDVSYENLRAKALYERFGFEVVRTIDSDLKNRFSYIPGHFKMFKYY